MDIKILLSKISGGEFDSAFSYLYGEENIAEAKNRYAKAVNAFSESYPEIKDVSLYSAPGRTEVSGNHTDHNHGRVLAASVNLDVIAVAGKSGDNIARVKSEGFDEDIVDLEDFIPNQDEFGRSSSLIRGIAARFTELGYPVGGFCAYTTSTVLKGSGLSSSAAFETLIGTILNYEYASGKVDAVEIAKIGQFAENVFFGKPCGLLDQTASSVGSFVAIDFENPEKPIIEKIAFDFAKSGYALCIVDTGGNHADLTGDYASVPMEMKAVAEALGGKTLKEVGKEAFYKALPDLHSTLSDRALLRAIHFFNEDERAATAAEALKKNDFEEFKNIIIDSGKSSFTYLQNVYTCKNPDEQGLSLALALAEDILKGKGAYRVHGGGFAGTIQSFVPNELLGEFKETMEAIFGENHCYCLKIRPVGGIKVSEALGK
ncbi:MAG: galactokinase [Oscillospiraceae bacterium]|nr:galactokinase [Oscillospiraceae bacterium]